jgi:hypothetical protein
VISADQQALCRVIMEEMLNRRDPRLVFLVFTLLEKTLPGTLSIVISSYLTLIILYFLSKNPDVLAKLRQEVHRLRGKNDLTLDDFMNLPYMETVMKETGRIYWVLWDVMPLLTTDSYIKKGT